MIRSWIWIRTQIELWAKSFWELFKTCRVVSKNKCHKSAGLTRATEYFFCVFLFFAALQRKIECNIFWCRWNRRIESMVQKASSMSHTAIVGQRWQLSEKGYTSSDKQHAKWTTNTYSHSRIKWNKKIYSPHRKSHKYIKTKRNGPISRHKCVVWCSSVFVVRYRCLWCHFDDSYKSYRNYETMKKTTWRWKKMSDGEKTEWNLSLLLLNIFIGGSALDWGCNNWAKKNRIHQK